MILSPPANFGDHAYRIRQDYIQESRLQIKLDALRERMHSEGLALVGEEAEAKRRGWQIYHTHRGWKPAPGGRL